MTPLTKSVEHRRPDENVDAAALQPHEMPPPPPSPRQKLPPTGVSWVIPVVGIPAVLFAGSAAYRLGYDAVLRKAVSAIPSTGYYPPELRRVAADHALGYGAAAASAVAALLMFAAYVLHRRRIAVRRRRMNLCACGYPRTGNTSGVCPECGRVL